MKFFLLLAQNITSLIVTIVSLSVVGWVWQRVLLNVVLTLMTGEFNVVPKAERKTTNVRSLVLTTTAAFCCWLTLVFLTALVSKIVYNLLSPMELEKKQALDDIERREKLKRHETFPTEADQHLLASETMQLEARKNKAVINVMALSMVLQGLASAPLFGLRSSQHQASQLLQVLTVHNFSEAFVNFIVPLFMSFVGITLVTIIVLIVLSRDETQENRSVISDKQFAVFLLGNITVSVAYAVACDWHMVLESVLIKDVAVWWARSAYACSVTIIVVLIQVVCDFEDSMEIEEKLEILLEKDNASSEEILETENKSWSLSPTRSIFLTTTRNVLTLMSGFFVSAAWEDILLRGNQQLAQVTQTAARISVFALVLTTLTTWWESMVSNSAAQDKLHLLKTKAARRRLSELFIVAVGINLSNSWENVGEALYYVMITKYANTGGPWRAVLVSLIFALVTTHVFVGLALITIRLNDKLQIRGKTKDIDFPDSPEELSLVERQ